MLVMHLMLPGKIVYYFIYFVYSPYYHSTRETIIPSLVEKCLGATKAGTKQKATDIILLYAEIDTPEPILVSILVYKQKP